LREHSSKKYSSPREKLLIESFRVLNSDLELHTVVRNALGILIKRFNARGTCLILVDLHDYSLNCLAAESGSPERIYTFPLEDEKSIPGWDSASKKPIVIDKIDAGAKYSEQIRDSLGFTPGSILNVPLFAGGEFLGLVQAINGGDDGRFEGQDLELLEVIAERIALTLRNAWILEEAIRALEEAKSLHEIGIALSGSLELDELLDKILANLKRVIKYEIAIIYLVDPRDGTINQIATYGLEDTVQERLHLKMGQGICGRVAQTGQGVIASDVSADPDYVVLRAQTKSEMAVPVSIDNNIIGVFNIESDTPNAYTKHDLELMNGYASLAAVSIERARLHRERLVAKQLEDELGIARRIQMTFLPSRDPQIPGFDVAGINIPSTAVGGDYYDFIPIVSNQFGIAIGDVSGKGIPASLIMAAFRAGLKAEIRNNFAIRVILHKVNNLLYESIDRDMFVTAVYGVLDSRNRIFTFSNAGHNPPILKRGTGEVEYLGEGGVALGALQGSLYEERPISLIKGDILLFYTDGVTEVIDENGEEFGVKRLLQFLDNSQHLTAREIIENIVSETKKFSSANRETDDLTMIVIKTL
jgi:sigma-B regulation protein RsbU (phosphoserine phosphatase)